MPADDMDVMLTEASAYRMLLRPYLLADLQTPLDEALVVNAESPALWAKKGLSLTIYFEV